MVDDPNNGERDILSSLNDSTFLDLEDGDEMKFSVSGSDRSGKAAFEAATPGIDWLEATGIRAACGHHHQPDGGACRPVA